MAARKQRSRRGQRSPRGAPGAPWWVSLPEQELLGVRLCELGLGIEGTALESRIEQLMGELARVGLCFQPSIWLSTDWFSPSGVPGFALPFYLAHPRLARLEGKQMFEVEGGNRDWCMNLLRHEAGHAMDTAYRLRRKKGWRECFGSPAESYYTTYTPRPTSRYFVHNLDNWYAQSHPIEDFAETFAVWLKPRSRWRTRYAGWPALAKLEYVDELMEEIGERPPPVRSRERTDSLSQLRTTLGQYYLRKKKHYGQEDRSVYDRDLYRLFTDDPSQARRRPAAAFLRDRRVELRRVVAQWSGQYRFVVDQVLRSMMVRSRDLRLYLAYSERETAEGAAVLLTVHTMRLIRRRHAAYFR